MSLRPRWQIYLLAASYPVLHYFFPVLYGFFPPWWVFTLAIFMIYCAAYAWPGAAQAASILLVNDSREVDTEPAHRSSAWFWSGFVFMLAAFAFLEVRQPLYFAQDDGVAQFIPDILQGMHSVQQGIFPTWNPYQYMGSPTTTVGTFGFTYPPTYLAYWIAKDLLRNEYLVLDVFSVLHLLGAYAATFWVIRREQARPSLAMLGGLCCALSGYALIVGRSWYNMTPVFLWVPLLVGLLRLAIDRPPDWRWIAAFGTCIGLYFHSPNVQMWAYTLLLLAVAVGLLLITGGMPMRHIMALLAGGLLGIAVSAPLLVPEMLAVRGIKRGMIAGGISRGLPTLFVPISVVHTMHPLGWGGPSRDVVGEMYYSGTLFCVVGVLLLLAIIAFRWGRETLKSNLWFPSALLALILALGPDGILWNLLWKVPGFNKFRTAFKFLALFDILIAIAGAVALERLMRRWRWRLRSEIALACIVVALLAYHCTLSTGSFFVYGFRPFPQIDPNIRQLLEPKQDRDYPKLFPLAAYRSGSPEWLNSMTQQWPTLFGFFSFSGYEPLVEDVPEYQRMQSLLNKPDGFARFGIRYVIVDKSEPDLWDQERLTIRLFGRNNVSGAHLTAVYQSSQVKVFELAAPDPMAFEESEPSTPLPVTFDGGGATIDTSQTEGSTIILNMLRRPEIRASANNKTALVDQDRWDRIRIHLSGHAARVRVEFRPPWGLGFMVAFLALCASAAFGILYMRMRIDKPASSGIGNSEEVVLESVEP